jgi:general secretion pathway protein G
MNKRVVKQGNRIGIKRKATKGRQSGFTLVEVLMVVVILAMLSAIAIPKVSASSDIARRNADIASAHQVKLALDRYQVENGVYPKTGQLIDDNKGNITSAVMIPKYIGKLDVNTTQQQATDGKKGFGVEQLAADGSIPEIKTNLIMIYLNGEGTAAEVRVYDVNLDKVLWSSAN